MKCEYQQFCGGCAFRDMDEDSYRKQKEDQIKSVLSKIKQDDLPFSETIFLPDSIRRRTSLSFAFIRGNLVLGYNQKKTNEIFDCYKCLLLTPNINRNMLNIRKLLEALADIPFSIKNKRKITTSYLQNGSVYICEADNGIDILLEFDKELSLEHRMIIAETSSQFVEIIRISHRKKETSLPETIVEKTKPVVNIKGTDVYIPPTPFLQASKEAEIALVNLILKYSGTITGKCMDLFCGIGTFSYPLSLNSKNKIISADSAKEALSAFETTIKSSMISNITPVNKNLFKYPFTADEMKNYDLIVFDPPRSGAQAQVKEISKIPFPERPKKIIAISCNPETFVNDANVLLNAEYKISNITIVDQFIYSPHAEVVALFEKNI